MIQVFMHPDSAIPFGRPAFDSLWTAATEAGLPGRDPSQGGPGGISSTRPTTQPPCALVVIVRNAPSEEALNMTAD